MAHLQTILNLVESIVTHFWCKTIWDPEYLQRHFDDIATFREGLGGTMKYLWASWQNITDLDPRKWTVPSQIYQILFIFLVHHHPGMMANFHNTCSATEKRWRDLRSCGSRSSMTILSIPGISLSNSSYSWYRDGLATYSKLCFKKNPRSIG